MFLYIITYGIPSFRKSSCLTQHLTANHLNVIPTFTSGRAAVSTVFSGQCNAPVWGGYPAKAEEGRREEEEGNAEAQEGKKGGG